MLPDNVQYGIMIFTAIGALGSVGSALIVYCAFRLARKTLNTQHRKAAHEIVEKWANQSKEERFYALLEILYFLGTKGIKKLLANTFETIDVTPISEILTTCLCKEHGSCTNDCKACRIMFNLNASQADARYLTDHAAILLRSKIGIYLNSLETVFSAWINGFADKKMIEMEFSFLWETTNLRPDSLSFRQLLELIDPLDDKDSIFEKCKCPFLWQYISIKFKRRVGARDLLKENT